MSQVIRFGGTLALVEIVELKKNRDWFGILNQFVSPKCPYGDQPRDAAFNSAGMAIAEEEQ